MATFSYDDIQRMDKLIRQGNAAEVSQFLSSLVVKSIPRKSRLSLANLARRVHNYSLALKILNPVVRSKNSLTDPPTNEESILYAEILRKMGALLEAKEILSSIDHSVHPQVLLYSSLCDFSVWDYEKSIPKLVAYVASDKVSKYDQVIGKLNLAAAYVYTPNQQNNAARLLGELREATTLADFRLLHGHVLELSANFAISNGDYREAREFLTQGEVVLQGASELDRLWLRKWQAVLVSLQSASVSPKLLEVRELARQNGRDETVRHCDLYIGHISQDPQLLDRVYHGTPFAMFRSYIKALTSKWYRPSARYVRTSGNLIPLQSFNVATTEIDHRGPLLKVGKVPHRLLMLLAKDAYSSLSTVSAFSQLFPGEHFNPSSSGDRIHQAVKRLRESLKKQRINLRVELFNGNYQLVQSPDLGLVVDQTIDVGVPEEVQWCNACRSVQDGFTSLQLSQALKLSRSSATALVKWAVARHYLSIHGAGPSTRYYFAEASQLLLAAS